MSFWLKVKPRSSRERLARDAAGHLRLEVHAPPAAGEANEACIEFFARALRLPRICVEILSGHQSRRKLIGISGRSGKETAERLRALAQQGRGGRG